MFHRKRGIERVKITIRINGQELTWDILPGALLIDSLRDNGFLGVKRGCDTGDCGACAVVVDDKVVNACVTFTGTTAGREILTIEGLGSPEALHPLQQAFLDCAAVQCGFCTPGMLLVAKDLLDRNLSPSEEEVRKGMAGVLCRCTGYRKPVEAVLLAAEKMRHGVDGATDPGGREDHE